MQNMMETRPVLLKRVGDRSRALKRDQLGLHLERAADSHVVLIAADKVGIFPRKSLTCRWIVWLIVNRAAAVLKKRAALVPDTRSPFSPACLVNQSRPMIQLDCLCFFLRQSRSKRAA